jgi:hypothetical protein
MIRQVDTTIHAAALQFIADVAAAKASGTGVLPTTDLLGLTGAGLTDEERTQLAAGSITLNAASGTFAAKEPATAFKEGPSNVSIPAVMNGVFVSETDECIFTFNDNATIQFYVRLLFIKESAHLVSITVNQTEVIVTASNDMFSATIQHG